VIWRVKKLRFITVDKRRPVKAKRRVISHSHRLSTAGIASLLFDYIENNKT